MATKNGRSRGGRRFVVNVHKPHGVIQPRVQQVGPERFGIVSVDCAKARFKWMLCDFYGKVLVSPTTVDHNRPELDRARDGVEECVGAGRQIAFEDGGAAAHPSRGQKWHPGAAVDRAIFV